MADYSFDPQLHRLLKQNLSANIEALAQCQEKEGRKLQFHPHTGIFTHDDSSNWDRFWRNLGEDHKDSATSRTMFEYPILITFYECKKLAVKTSAQLVNAQPAQPANPQALDPDLAMSRAIAGLKFLRDKTYSGTRKKDQRTAITVILTKVDQLQLANTRPAIDELIAAWVPFALPAAFRQLVVAAAQDAKVKEIIQQGLVANTAQDQVISAAQKRIYDRHYKSGGSDGFDNVGSCDAYLNNLCTIAARYQAEAWPQGISKPLPDVLNDFRNGRTVLGPKDKNGKSSEYSHASQLGFIHFKSPQWTGGAQARVYLHVKADANGNHAQTAVTNVFDSLAVAYPGGTLATHFRKFKVGNIHQLFKDTDGIVAWCSDLAAAKQLAKVLAARPNFAGLLAPGLPIGVKPVSLGIGVSTEPEYGFDARFKTFPHAKTSYSFGTHRTELIARGLLLAAISNGNLLPNLETCCERVATEVSNTYLINPYKVYKPAICP